MASNFNFGASIRLNATQFKKGVAEVKASINGLWASFKGFSAALGAGLGFGAIVAQVKDTVKDLSVAEATLRNVSHNSFESMSKASAEYADNLDYLRKMSKDLSQNYIALVNNFAQFRASCQNTNLTLEQQKNIFESLTQAATYYHMSADRTNNMMIAIIQMMSKGKVSAEELRRQLGNALPGAFNMMATAIGVTTAKLEDMMKKGQVISEDALPKFAALLKVTTRLTDDSLNSVQLKLNAVSNAWTNFVKSGNFEKAYSWGLDKVASLLNYIAQNLSRVKSTIIATLGSIGTMKLFNGIVKQGEEAGKKLVANWTKSVKQMQRENSKLQTNLMNYRQKYGSSFISKDQTSGEITVSATKPKGMHSNTYTALVDNSKQYNENLQKINETQNKINKGLGTWQKLGLGIKSIFSNIVNNLLASGYAMIAGAILGVITKVTTHLIDQHKRLKAINNLIKDQKAEYDKVESEISKEVESVLLARTLFSRMNKDSAEAAVQIKKLNDEMGLTGDEALKVTDSYETIIERTNDWLERLKQVARVQQLIGQITENQNKMDLNNMNVKDLFKQWQSKANYRQGLTLNKVFNSNGTIKDTSEWAEGAWDKTWGKTEPKLKQISEMLRENVQLQSANKMWEQKVLDINTETAKRTGRDEEAAYKKLVDAGKKRTLEQVTDYLNKYGDINSKNTEQAKIWQRQLQIASEGGSGSGKDKDPIKKLDASLKSLEEQHKANLITDAEYNKKVADEIADAIDDKLKKEPKWLDTDAGKKYSSQLKEYQGKVKEDENEKSSANKLKKANETIVDASTELATSLKNISNHKDIYGFSYTDEEAKEKTTDAYNDFLDALNGIDVEGINGIDNLADYIKEKYPEIYDQLKDAWKNINQASQEKFNKLISEIEEPTKPVSRDKFFDYKMDEKDVAKDDFKNYQTYTKDITKWISEMAKAEKNTDGMMISPETIDKIKGKLAELAQMSGEKGIVQFVANAQIDNLEDALNILEELGKATDSLDYKAKLAEMTVDIKKYEENLAKGFYSGIKDIATTADRINNAVQSFADAFDMEIDEDTLDQWKKLEAIFNLITQTIDGFSSLAQTFDNITGIMDKLTKAEETYEATKAAGSLGKATEMFDATPIQQNTAAITENTLAKTANIGANEASAIAEGADAVATEANADAKGVEAGANLVDSSTANVNAGAHSKSAIAKIADAFASNPIAGALVLAAVGAGIAGIVAMLKSAGAFANGGMVNYGSSSGDKTLARVNKGEGILTANGVKNLNTLYNAQTQNRGGNVNFKIRGTDLIGVINNTQSRIKG